MRALTSLALAALGVGSAACGTTEKWQGSIGASPELLAREFGPAFLDEPVPDLEPPNIPMPRGVRPCCSFGSGLRVELGSVPVPALMLTNVVGIEDLGPHIYDHGVVSMHASRPGGDVLTSERNGLVYTCHGGFVDVAHLRDWTDWTVFLAGAIGRSLESGTSLDLPDEGGYLVIITRPADPDRLARDGRLQLAVPLAQWLAFQLSVWHEIATWYGWSVTGFFPEEASAFSPEDLYSNLLGIKLAGVLTYLGQGTSEAAYNDDVDTALPRVLQRLAAVPGATGRLAMASIDGVWWDSHARLPEKGLVLRRYFEIGDKVSPWLVSNGWRKGQESAVVAEACNGREEPVVLRNPQGAGDAPFREQATLEIEVEPALAARMPLPDPASRRITQDDFPALIERIRADNALEFGAAADRPDAP